MKTGEHGRQFGMRKTECRIDESLRDSSYQKAAPQVLHNSAFHVPRSAFRIWNVPHSEFRICFGGSLKP